MFELKQFKLASGDEVLCEVIEWPKDDELEIIARNVLKVYSVMTATGEFQHTLKPWMVLQLAETNQVLINIAHVVGEGNPNKYCKEQYYKVVNYLLSPDDDDEEDVEEMTEKESPSKHFH